MTRDRNVLPVLEGIQIFLWGMVGGDREGQYNPSEGSHGILLQTSRCREQDKRGQADGTRRRMSFSGFGQREAVRSGRNPCIVSLTVIRSFRCPGISDERISRKTLERRILLKKEKRK